MDVRSSASPAGFHARLGCAELFRPAPAKVERTAELPIELLDDPAALSDGGTICAHFAPLASVR